MTEQSSNASEFVFYNKKHSSEQQQASKEVWQSSRTYKNILVFILLGFYFMVFGIVQLVMNTHQQSAQFVINCPGDSTVCKSSVPLFLSFNSQDTVSIYLKGGIQSINDIYTSLNSDYVLQSRQSNCGMFSTNQQISKTQAVAGNILNSTDNAIPCGFFPSKFPKGTLKIFQSSSGIPLNIRTDSLVLETAAYTSFKNIDLSKQWIDLTDGRFKSWMQQSSSLSLSRYWGYISEQISGSYEVSYEFETIQPLGQLFTISFQNNQTLGGFNVSLCVINFLFALGMFIASACTFFLNRKMAKLGSLQETQAIVFSSNEQNDQHSFDDTQNSSASISKNDKPYFKFRNPFVSTQQQDIKIQVLVKASQNRFKKKQADTVKEEEQDFQKPITNNRMIVMQKDKTHKKNAH